MNENSNKKINVEEVEVRTMKDDLAESDNPNIKKVANFENSFQPRKEDPIVSSAPFKSGSSPFLNQNIQSQNQKPHERIVSDESNIVSLPKNDSSTGKIIFVAISIVVILIIGVGGYYFWVTRMNIEQNTEIDLPAEVEPIVENIAEEVAEIKEEIQLPQFSLETPNYLMLGEGEADLAGVKKVLQKTADKMLIDNINVPLEFIVTNDENTPLTFVEFSQLSGLVFSQTAKDNMGSKFSLYMYNEVGKIKLGLGIDSLNDIQLKSALLKEEKALIANLNGLFLETAVTSKEIVFADSKYNGKAVRFYNINLAEKQSLDYSISNSRVYFGTSEKTLRSILDYVDKRSLKNAPEM